jgi:hypothetical protein
MAMAQLVYQMGVNLAHFTEFLKTINSRTSDISAPRMVTAELTTSTAVEDEATLSEDRTPEYWQSVQKSLMGSQWAHKYRTRAIAVIAMLDPAYGDDPSAAEQRVKAVLRPAVQHRRSKHAAVSARQVSVRRHRSPTKRGRAAHARKGEAA